MKPKLVQSPVLFDGYNHTYTLNGVALSGITSIISKYICPDKYKGIPAEVLQRAAEHGRTIHEQISHLVNDKFSKEAKQEFMNTCEPEVRDYVQLIKDNAIKILCSEYLVSDEALIASSIDLVDESFNLYDIKTTAKLDMDYMRWQLSIYAYLFELQNEDKKAGKLYGIHLRDGKADLIEIDRIPDNVVKSLIFCAMNNEEFFDNPLSRICEDEEELMDELRLIQSQMEKMEKREKEIKEFIRTRMEESGAYSIVNACWKITRSKDTQGVKFDEEAFKDAKPAMWAKFIKPSVKKGRLTITFPKEQ